MLVRKEQFPGPRVFDYAAWNKIDIILDERIPQHSMIQMGYLHEPKKNTHHAEYKTVPTFACEMVYGRGALK
jgi:hypothetical protein